MQKKRLLIVVVLLVLAGAGGVLSWKIVRERKLAQGQKELEGRIAATERRLE